MKLYVFSAWPRKTKQRRMLENVSGHSKMFSRTELVAWSANHAHNASTTGTTKWLKLWLTALALLRPT